MRWDCAKDGCFNQKQRPKIEVFDGCFRGSIAFGDIDAVVETKGRFLFLEWKRPGAPIPTGQRIMHQRLTELSPKITIVIVHGDAETMAVESVSFVHGGKAFPSEPCDLNQLRLRVARWFDRNDKAAA